jgi:hypothetical protein
MKKESERPPISEGRPDVETLRKESITKRLYIVEKAHRCAVNADLWDPPASASLKFYENGPQMVVSIRGSLEWRAKWERYGQKQISASGRIYIEKKEYAHRGKKNIYIGGKRIFISGKKVYLCWNIHIGKKRMKKGIFVSGKKEYLYRGKRMFISGKKKMYIGVYREKES